MKTESKPHDAYDGSGFTTRDDMDDESLFGSSLSSGPASLLEPNLSLEGAPARANLPASISPPPISGLYVFPGILPETTSSDLLQEIAKSDIFCGGQRNQAMLFSSGKASTTAFPTYLQNLCFLLEDLLASRLPSSTTSTLFHPSFADASSRQIILNLYRPGEGISPHINLTGRYADGIIGVCLGSGCVMDFENHDGGLVSTDMASKYSVYMPARTVYCLAGDARWKWNHGIASRDRDLVEDSGKISTILRDVRISITLRWMKPGAEVLK
ncbi:hypothetical protein NliqN6_3471 [Naganishia liquefaciens]|uniref:Fe2OG dioxygenase domain-containing protein n=1 Tax=Naganishia liquefaciens TaxID=104408 RepID=A0A8H3YF05_9TREE|nr:hypothetical protein NliqN6_3471 [Naganishia liquefaciens]